MIEQAWDPAGAFSVGIEEEVMILDAETLALVPEVQTLIAGVEGRDVPGALKTELFASVVELNSPPSASVADAMASIESLRRAGAEVGAANGLALAAAGAHPFSVPEEQEISPDPRYREFVDYAGVTARRQGVNGLHVHVGMPSADACFHALEGVLPWLPVVLALSANSPYLSGAATGMMSTRAEVLGLLPRRGAPPPFAGYAEWERFVERLAASGLVRDYTAIWWDVRPHPRFGTLELRVPDQPTAPARTAAFAALLHALCVATLEEPRRAPDAFSRGIYDQNRWAAARFGPRARLIHPDRDDAVPVAELAEELLERVRPAARAAGTDGLLDALDASGACEGDRQLEVGANGDLVAVARDLVERSVSSG